MINVKNRKKTQNLAQGRRSAAVGALFIDRKRDTVQRCFLIESALRTVRENRCR